MEVARILSYVSVWSLTPEQIESHNLCGGGYFTVVVPNNKKKKVKEMDYIIYVYHNVTIVSDCVSS